MREAGLHAAHAGLHGDFSLRFVLACSSGDAAGGDDPAPRTTTTAGLQGKHTDTHTYAHASVSSQQTHKHTHMASVETHCVVVVHYVHV